LKINVRFGNASHSWYRSPQLLTSLLVVHISGMICCCFMCRQYDVFSKEQDDGSERGWGSAVTGLRAKFICWLTENTPPLHYEDQLVYVFGRRGGGGFRIILTSKMPCVSKICSRTTFGPQSGIFVQDYMLNKSSQWPLLCASRICYSM